MTKISKAITIELHHNNHAKCPIYAHEDKFYIKANKPNTSSYLPFFYDGVEYSEVTYVGGYWFLA